MPIAVAPGRVRIVLMSALLILSVLPLAFVRGASAATDLYPDLETLPPRDLRFSTATIGGTSHRVLQFSNTVINTGAGKLDIVGVIDPTTRNGPANQRVYDDAGNYTQLGAGTFTWHDVHSHFHYDDWGRYELWTKGEYDAWVASGRSRGVARKMGTKTTSCLLDEEFIAEIPNTPWPKVYSSDGCNLSGNSTLHEGLSPGWGDTYDWYRDEQWVDLGTTPLADGTYVLRSVTDPRNMIYESAGKTDTAREGVVDNEGVTTFVVSGGVIQDGTAPTGTITVNDTSGSTSGGAVTVAALGRDDVSGVDSFRLSNDGASWQSFSYTPNSSAPTRVSWSLTDPATGGSATNGTKTVYAQFHDRSGKWGVSTTDTIVLGSATPPPPPPAAGYAGAVAADGPVGYWRLGETSGTVAADAIGTNTGAYVNSPALGQPTLVPTETNGSIGLTGTQYVRIPNSGTLQVSSPLSVEAWIRPTVVPAAGTFASVVTKAESWSLQFNGPQLEWTLIQNGSRKRLKAPAGAIVADRAYHVVGTYDGTTQRLYVNGSQVATAALTGPATVTTSPVVLGSWSGTDELLRGRIDDAAVYGKALSATRVAQHWSAGNGTAPPSNHTVSVSVNGAGTGSVTSSPAGISCPGTCSAPFPSGTSVTLTAAPASGSTFTGWTSGACAGTTPTCTFNAIAATSAGATFGTPSPSPSPSPSTSPPPPPPPPPPAGTYVESVRTDAPIAWWRFGEASGTTAADSARTHTGTWSGAPAVGAASLLTSDTDRAAALDGVDDHLRTPNVADLQLGTALSLEAWIRPDALPAAGGWATVVNKLESYALQFAGPQLELTIVQNGSRRRLRAPAGAVPVGQVSHVVGTYDGATQRLYVNGTLVASAALTGAASATTNALFVGSWDGASERFRGRVDEVAVYDKALAPARVSAHRSAGTAAP